MRAFYAFLLFIFFQINAFSQFEDPIIFETELNEIVERIHIADLDNDNLKDIIVLMRLNEVYWYKNLGNLNFSEKKTITDQAIEPVFVDVTDINNDGLNDVLITNSEGEAGGADFPNTELFINSNAGENWTKVTIDENVAGINHRNFFVDFDNDNDLDILNCNERTIALYTNDGSGNFGNKTTLVEQNEFYNLVVGDFNNDQKQDFITNTARGTMVYLQGNSTTTFNTSTINSQIISTVLKTDIDNDNDLDLLISLAGSADADFHTLVNDGTGNFTQQQVFKLFITVGQASNLLTFKDMDQDNFVDLVYIPINTKEITTQINNQSGIFEASTSINSDFNFTDIATDDLDNDGDNDIVWFSYESSPQVDKLGIIENNTSSASSNYYFKDKFMLFPNPTSGIINIKNLTNTNIKNISLYNGQGSELIKFNTIPNKIDLTSLASGLYFIKINSSVYKVIKE